MKVNINFTVEFDPEEYRKNEIANGLIPSTNAEIRSALQNNALARIIYGLSDEGIKINSAIHNN